MPGKERFVRSIDIPVVGAFDAGSDPGSTSAIAPPPLPSIGAPTNLQLTTTIERSAVSATALINATWLPPPGVSPSSYTVQWSVSNTFPDNNSGVQGADDESTTIRTLKPVTLYYVRVAAIVAGVRGDWSATANITTDSDTIPPDPPTSQAASFINAGDLVITWTNPASENLHDIEIGIYSDNTKTTTYALLYDATGRRVWTAAENLAATSQLGDPTVYVELRSRSWGGLFSTPVNASATKTRPATPTGLTTSWAGDTGAAGPDCTITWNAQTDASQFVVTIDGVSRTVYAPRLVYTLDQNRSEHSGTPDPVLSIIVAAYDGLKQGNAVSATTTATNAAPAAPTITLTKGWSEMICQVTSAPAADFAAYEYKWTRDGATVTRTRENSASQEHYEASAAADTGVHSWTCTVRQKDLFGQYSSGTASSSVTLDNFTIEYLRAGAFYSDSDGNTPATLAALKDGNTTSGGVTYAA